MIFRICVCTWIYNHIRHALHRNIIYERYNIISCISFSLFLVYIVTNRLRLSCSSVLDFHSTYIFAYKMRECVVCTCKHDVSLWAQKHIIRLFSFNDIVCQTRKIETFLSLKVSFECLLNQNKRITVGNAQNYLNREINEKKAKKNAIFVLLNWGKF